MILKPEPSVTPEGLTLELIHIVDPELLRTARMPHYVVTGTPHTGYHPVVRGNEPGAPAARIAYYDGVYDSKMRAVNKARKLLLYVQRIQAEARK